MTPHSILIIDDEEGIREILTMSLEDEGYEIYQASNGVEALNLLRTIPRPDLILLDYMMPVMDGKEFIEALNSDAELSQLNIPIVLITAFSRPEIEGISEVLYKPMDLDNLIKTAYEYCH